MTTENAASTPVTSLAHSILTPDRARGRTASAGPPGSIRFYRAHGERHSCAAVEPGNATARVARGNGRCPRRNGGGDR
jgi:hypothetical protein